MGSPPHCVSSPTLDESVALADAMRSPGFAPAERTVKEYVASGRTEKNARAVPSRPTFCCGKQVSPFALPIPYTDGHDPFTQTTTYEFAFRLERAQFALR